MAVVTAIIGTCQKALLLPASRNKVGSMTGMRPHSMVAPLLKFEFTVRLQQFCHSLRRTNARLRFSDFSMAKWG
jgi:hypothetical protein